MLRRRAERELREFIDINEFLTDTMMDFAQDQDYDLDREQAAFEFTFLQLATNLGDNSFKRFSINRKKFMGGFLLSAYEVMAIGLGYNFEQYQKPHEFDKDLEAVAVSLWSNTDFTSRTGSGIRASLRIPYIIPLGRQLLAP